MQVSRAGDMKARIVPKDFAADGKPDLFEPVSLMTTADVVDMLGMVHGWSRSTGGTAGGPDPADDAGPAARQLPVKWLSGWVAGDSGP